MAAELKGLYCHNWQVLDLINHGKSAAVFRVKKGAKTAAIKFFDPEIVSKHGAGVQAKRVEREQSLAGKSHPNLIKIIGGGFWKEKELFFVIMEYLPWKNLTEALKSIPVGSERNIIRQIASAAHFLERLNICHRDIKPENIAISPDLSTVKLLDLGVLKPHAEASITDAPKGRPFLGTLKYSPPEFLLGHVQNNTIGWRAVTFYQIGGVLHDLITRHSLFEDFEEPFARLVNAIQFTKPEIQSDSVSPSLVQLARDCLIKAPEVRSKLVNWGLFEKAPPKKDVIAALQSKITNRHIQNLDSPPTNENSSESSAEKLATFAANIQSVCKVECISQRTIFPPIECHVRAGPDNDQLISLHFDPSAPHALLSHIRIQLILAWTDAKSDVVRISINAILGKESISDETPPLADSILCFEGTFSGDAAQRAIFPFLYKAIDQAQQDLVAWTEKEPHRLIAL